MSVCSSENNDYIFYIVQDKQSEESVESDQEIQEIQTTDRSTTTAEESNLDILKL